MGCTEVVSYIWVRPFARRLTSYEHSMHKSSVVREESDTQTRQQTASGKSTKTKTLKSNSRGSGN